MRDLPSQEELHRLFDYDDERGELIWKSRPESCASRNTRRAGTTAGFLSHGGTRLKLEIDGAQFYVHRIIWKMFNNSEPPEIDHKDCDGLNNRIGNLRAATKSQNQRNRRRSKGKALPKGVYYRGRGRYQAMVTYDGKQHNVGSFRDPALAHAAYVIAIALHYGEFGRAD